jgi:hypothetical protein
MFDELARGEWRNDSDHEDADGWPDSNQPNDRIVLMRVISHFASTGTVISRGSINSLQGGIWEFKRSRKRVSFYDTDGQGTAYNRQPNPTSTDCSRPEDPMWHIPDFDQQLRLGWCFPKTGEQTNQEDIQQTLTVREEDLSYDRAA